MKEKKCRLDGTAYEISKEGRFADPQWPNDVDRRDLRLPREEAGLPGWRSDHYLSGRRYSMRGFARIAAVAAAVLSIALASQASPPLSLSYSTYFGGPTSEHWRDVATDSQGFIYVAGGAEAGYPVTPGAYDTSHNGSLDVVVTKFDPTGQRVIWSTYLGGPSLDRAYAIEVDAQGCVYVAGRAGNQFPTTPGAVQTAFRGGPAGGPYPPQDKFVAKLSPNGDQLVFSTYFGAFDDSSTPIRDIAIDAAGNIYIGTSTFTGNYNAAILAAFQNGFDSTHAGGRDGVVAKINPTGTQVLWATYLGGSGEEWGECSVRTDPAGNVYYLTATDSMDARTTNGAYDRSHNGGTDFYIAKINANGTLSWATYLGGSGNEHVETHELELDAQGNVVVASGTTSTNYPTTPGAYDATHNGNGGSATGANSNYPGDVAVTKISPTGDQLVASTYIGGRYGDSGEGVAVDAQGNVYVTGGVYSDNFPTTPGAYQSGRAGSLGTISGFLVKLSPNLDQLLYATYFGTSNGDLFRCAAIDPQGSVYLANSTASASYPLLNPIQSAHSGSGDATLVRFSQAFACECDDWRTAHPDWIWCDDFETNRLGSYFEYDSAGGNFTRAASVGIYGSTGMKVIFPTGTVSPGSLHLAFGRTPSSYMRPVDAGTNDYRELYWRVYLRRQPGWIGGGGDKLSRAIILANANWAEAAFGHVWSGGAGNNYLVLDPASGTDPAGNLVTTVYNDFPNMRWLGYVQSVTPVFDNAHAGSWYCIEAHMKLNDASAANGLFELWINGQLEARKTNLNWVGSYDAYGINAVFLENYWGAGSPTTQERYFDNFVVSTRPIGPVGGTNTPPVITNFALNGTNCVISFTNVPGRNYDVQRANDLASGVWSTVATNIPGTGGTIQITDTNAAGQTERFYRVRTLQ